MSISLSNSTDIIANSISLIKGNVIEDITETFLSKTEAVSNIIGLPPSTMNTLEKISESLANNPQFFNTIETSISTKASTIDVEATFSEYDNRIVADDKLELKSNVADVASQLNLIYSKVQTDALISSLIDGSPAVLNTMKELASALNNDENYATNIQTQIAAKAPQTTTYTKAENDTQLNAKADQATTYTKTSVDNGLNAKANQTTTYTKTENDTQLNTKANQTTTYTKTQTDTIVANKANQSTTYNKSEVDGLITSYDWITQTGDFNHIDANVGGLILESNNATAVQVLGSSNTGEEGSVLFYKNVTVLGTSTLGGDAVITGNVTVDNAAISNIQCKTSAGLKIRDAADTTNLVTVTNTGTVLIPGNVIINGDIRVDGDNNISYNPFKYAGKIDGENVSVISTRGRNDFTVSRPSGYGVGIYKITFSENMDSANYVINIQCEKWAVFSIVWSYISPTANNFHVVIYNTGNTLTDSLFHFSIL
jgi:hypothetical protein